MYSKGKISVPAATPTAAGGGMNELGYTLLFF